ncbi:MAG: hypothetical protein NXY57DRAFT_1006319 [Lentinula lateritia]|nr:MAG: hypothetical protein NXY57DRAFT_1006319 [Lentinula lateritia]
MYSHHPHTFYSPSSSPPSSPCPFPDSSPASSPTRSTSDLPSLDLLNADFSSPSSLNSHSPPLHPFSGSAKQVKQFRIHEKKTTMVKRSLSPDDYSVFDSSPTNLTAKKVRYGYVDKDSRDKCEEDLLQPPKHRGSSMAFEGIDFNSPNLFDPDAFNNLRPSVTGSDPVPEKLFEDTVEKAYMDCSLHIAFGRQNLSYLPERGIIDLNNIVILDQYSEQNFVNPETIVRSAASRSSSNSNSEQSTSTSDLTFHHHRKRSQAHRLNMSRTPSTRTLPGVPRQSMTLLLADNLLTRLPPQLFHLDRLTVLSLRSNKLAFLPPEIVFLASLKELNVANNKLAYLPAEMLGMTLSKLSVQPNPFISPPLSLLSETRSFRRTLTRSKTSKSRLGQAVPRLTSPVKLIFKNGVPSLFELCLRAFTTTSNSNYFNPFSSLSAANTSFPSFTPSPTETFNSPTPNQTPTKNTPGTTISSISPHVRRPKIELIYDLPPESTSFLPPSVQRRLHYAVPGSVKGYSSDDEYGNRCQSQDRDHHSSLTDTNSNFISDLDEVTGVGFCPSPRHRHHGPNGLTSSLCYQHTEERFTWESTIAGVENLGEIPVRWRGCLKGCLGFLDVGDEDQDVEKAEKGKIVSTSIPMPILTLGPDSDVGTAGMTLSPPMDTDLDLEHAVKPVDLSGVEFTENDFDDE